MSGVPISLIGLSGAGKSTISGLLAARLGWRWLDTDHLIVQRDGRDIADIFAFDGEGAFRDLETVALRDALVLAERQPHVIATGGGIVLRPINRAILRDCTFCVWLDAPTSVLIPRLDSQHELRPLLSGFDPAVRLEALRTQRAPLYREAAQYMLDTTGQTPAQVVDAICAAYAEHHREG